MSVPSVVPPSIEAQSERQIRIRGAVPRPATCDTDIMVTKNSAYTSILSNALKFLSNHKEVTIHALGAAIYKAMKAAISIKNSNPSGIDLKIETGTQKSRDFYIPTSSGQTMETKDRNLNFVSIKIIPK